jgi:hypothetical protein
MAEQISLFGIAVGGAFLLVGLTLAGAIARVRIPSLDVAPVRQRAEAAA